MVSFTTDAGHLHATRPAVEADLAGDRLVHLDKARQEQDNLHFMVGQVSTTADALGPLIVGPTKKDDYGLLVDVFWVEPGESEKKIKRHGTIKSKYYLCSVSVMTQTVLKTLRHEQMMLAC